MQTYDQLKAEATSTTQSVVQGLQEEKRVPHETYDAAVVSIAAREDASLVEAGKSFDEKLQELRGSRPPLSEQLGEWQAVAKNPQPDPELSEALRRANDALHAQAKSLCSAQNALAASIATQVRAKAAFDRQEDAIRLARSKLTEAESDLARVEALFIPAPGTLLHALRSHPDVAWKANLAKVIDPSILVLEDLGPEFIDAEDPTLFGWGVNLNNVPSPGWTDDASALAALDDAKELVIGLKESLQTAVEILGGIAADLRRADEVVKLAQAEKGVYEAQAQPLSATRDKAELDLRHSAAAAGQRATERVAEIKRQLNALDEQLQAVNLSKEARNRSIRREYTGLREAALADRNQAIQRIDQLVVEEQNALRIELASLERQKTERLEKAGVDVEELHILQNQAAEVRQELQDRKSVV